MESFFWVGSFTLKTPEINVQTFTNKTARSIFNWTFLTINISPLSTHYYRVLHVHEIIALNIIMVQVKLETILMNNTFHYILL